MDALVLLYDYFEDRAAAAASIRARRPLAIGFLGALLGGTSLFVAQGLAGRLFLLGFSWPAWMLSLSLCLAVILALTACLHLVLDLTGARGDAGALFVHLGLSELAWLAAVPAILLAQVLSPMIPSAPRAAFLAGAACSLILKIRALADEYEISSGRAVLTMILPVIAFILLFMLFAALAAVSLFMKAAVS